MKRFSRWRSCNDVRPLTSMNPFVREHVQTKSTSICLIMRTQMTSLRGHLWNTRTDSSGPNGGANTVNRNMKWASSVTLWFLKRNIHLQRNAWRSDWTLKQWSRFWNKLTAVQRNKHGVLLRRHRGDEKVFEKEKRKGGGDSFTLLFLVSLWLQESHSGSVHCVTHEVSNKTRWTTWAWETRQTDD